MNISILIYYILFSLLLYRVSYSSNILKCTHTCTVFQVFVAFFNSAHISGFCRVLYEKQRHFHGLAYRKLNRLQARLQQLDHSPESVPNIEPSEHSSENGSSCEPSLEISISKERKSEIFLSSDQRSENGLFSEQRREEIEQLFFIPQDLSCSVPTVEAPQSKAENLQALGEYFDLLPNL
jgi:hypothetical protein